MTTTTMSMSGVHDAPWLERATLLLLLVFVGAVQVSIVAAQGVLMLLLIAWVATMVRDGTRPSAPPFYRALLAYAGITLVSAAFSLDPIESVIDSRKGRVRLVSSRPGRRSQRAIFRSGIFKVKQKKGEGGVTDIVLRGGLFGCTAAASGTKAEASVLRRRRRLWGRGRMLRADMRRIGRR